MLELLSLWHHFSLVDEVLARYHSCTVEGLVTLLSEQVPRRLRSDHGTYKLAYLNPVTMQWMGEGYSEPYTFKAAFSIYFFTHQGSVYSSILTDGKLLILGGSRIAPFLHGPVLQVVVAGGDLFVLGSDGIIYALGATGNWVIFLQLPQSKRVTEFAYRNHFLNGLLLILDHTEQFYVLGQYRGQKYPDLTLVDRTK